MFQSSTIIRELALNLGKVIFALKRSVKLHCYWICGCVAACHNWSLNCGMAFLLFGMMCSVY